MLNQVFSALFCKPSRLKNLIFFGQKLSEQTVFDSSILYEQTGSVFSEFYQPLHGWQNQRCGRLDQGAFQQLQQRWIHHYLQLYCFHSTHGLGAISSTCSNKLEKKYQHSPVSLLNVITTYHIHEANKYLLLPIDTDNISKAHQYTYS